MPSVTAFAVRAAAATIILGAVGRIALDSGAPAVSFAIPTAQPPRIMLSEAPLARLSGIAPGEVRSILRVRGPLRYGDFVWNEEGAGPGRAWVRVDRAAQTISVFRGKHEIGTAVILYGADEKPTPSGRFAVLEKRKVHRSSLYDADMPYTLRLTHDGIAIHASTVAQGAATHGCIGLPPDFARRVFEHVQVGDEVRVV